MSEKEAIQIYRLRPTASFNVIWQWIEKHGAKGFTLTEIMPEFPELTKEQMTDILDFYIRDEKLLAHTQPDGICPVRFVA